MKYYQVAFRNHEEVPWASPVPSAVQSICKAASGGRRRRRRPIQLKLLPPAMRVLRHIEQATSALLSTEWIIYSSPYYS